MENNSREPAKFTGCRPVLRVSNLAESLRYYCENLGFVHEWSWPGEKELGTGQHPTFAYVFRGYFELFLSEEDPVGSAMTIVIGLPSAQSVDDLWVEYQNSSANVIEPPSERSWGTYEMCVRDLDGHLLRILR